MHRKKLSCFSAVLPLSAQWALVLLESNADAEQLQLLNLTLQRKRALAPLPPWVDAGAPRAPLTLRCLAEMNGRVLWKAGQRRWGTGLNLGTLEAGRVVRGPDTLQLVVRGGPVTALMTGNEIHDVVQWMLEGAGVSAQELVKVERAQRDDCEGGGAADYWVLSFASAASRSTLLQAGFGNFTVELHEKSERFSLEPCPPGGVPPPRHHSMHTVPRDVHTPQEALRTTSAAGEPTTPRHTATGQDTETDTGRQDADGSNAGVATEQEEPAEKRQKQTKDPTSEAAPPRHAAARGQTQAGSDSPKRSKTEGPKTKAAGKSSRQTAKQPTDRRTRETSPGQGAHSSALAAEKPTLADSPSDPGATPATLAPTLADLDDAMRGGAAQAPFSPTDSMANEVQCDLCGAWHEVDEEVMRQFGGEGVPFQCCNLDGQTCKPTAPLDSALTVRNSDSEQEGVKQTNTREEKADDAASERSRTRSDDSDKQVRTRLRQPRKTRTGRRQGASTTPGQ